MISSKSNIFKERILSNEYLGTFNDDDNNYYCYYYHYYDCNDNSNNNDNSSNSKKYLMKTNSVRKRSIKQVYTPGRS